MEFVTFFLYYCLYLENLECAPSIMIFSDIVSRNSWLFSCISVFYSVITVLNGAIGSENPWHCVNEDVMRCLGALSVEYWLGQLRAFCCLWSIERKYNDIRRRIISQLGHWEELYLNVWSKLPVLMSQRMCWASTLQLDQRWHWRSNKC